MPTAQDTALDRARQAAADQKITDPALANLEVWLTAPEYAGYVEAMATDPDRQGEGFGTAVLEEVSDLLRAEFQLGVLSTGDPGFYEQAGWVRWQGPSFVIDAGERRRTLDEDDGIVALPFGESSGIDPTDRIACEARAGDDW